MHTSRSSLDAPSCAFASALDSPMVNWTACDFLVYVDETPVDDWKNRNIN